KDIPTDSVAHQILSRRRQTLNRNSTTSPCLGTTHRRFRSLRMSPVATSRLTASIANTTQSSVSGEDEQQGPSASVRAIRAEPSAQRRHVSPEWMRARSEVDWSTYFGRVT